MVTRRQVLAAAGAGVGLGVVGVVADDAVHSGLVWEKWIRGRLDGNRHIVHSVVADSNQGTYIAETTDELDLFEDTQGRRPVISDDDHARIEEVFSDVEYGIDVCTDDRIRDCAGGRTSRADFNAVQINDQATVLDRGKRIHLLRAP